MSRRRKTSVRSALTKQKNKQHQQNQYSQQQQQQQQQQKRKKSLSGNQRKSTTHDSSSKRRRTTWRAEEENDDDEEGEKDGGLRRTVGEVINRHHDFGDVPSTPGRRRSEGFSDALLNPGEFLNNSLYRLLSMQTMSQKANDCEKL